MALIPIRIDRTSKPPIGTPLRSDGHWSVQGLVGTWAFNEGGGTAFFNAVEPSALPGVTSGAAIISPAGLTGDGSINAEGLYPITAEKLPKDAFTLFYIARRTGSSTQYSKPLCLGGGSAVKIGFEQPSSTAGALVGKAYIGASGRQTPAITNALPLGSLTILTMVYDGLALSLRSGSIPAVSVACSGSVTYDTYGMCFLGRPDTATQNYPAEIQGSLLYNVALLLGQQQSLISNPWQIYEPETVWIEVGGGGEIFSGTFSTSIESLIQYGVGQIGCGGGMSANAGSAAYSMGGLEGKQGDLSISIANLLQFLSGKSGNTADIQSTITTLSFLLSGKSGNSANFNSQLLSLTQSLNGQHGVSAALVASIGNLSAMFGEQVVFQGTVSAVTATFVSSISGITGNIGQTLASISVASVISGITGNSGLVQGALNQISGQWIGNVGVSGSALMYVSTGTEMVGKLGVSASIASELNEIGAYLIEIVTGGKIDRIVISTKTGSAVILTATGKINITTN